MVTPIQYNSNTRNFALGEPLNSDKSLAQRSSLNQATGDKVGSQKWVIVYKNNKTNQTSQKKLTANTKIDALGKFRNSLRFNVLQKGFFRPVNIRVFKYPEEASEAAEYRSEIDGR